MGLCLHSSHSTSAIPLNKQGVGLCRSRLLCCWQKPDGHLQPLQEKLAAPGSAPPSCMSCCRVSLALFKSQPRVQTWQNLVLLALREKVHLKWWVFFYYYYYFSCLSVCLANITACRTVIMLAHVFSPPASLPLPAPRGCSHLVQL